VWLLAACSAGESERHRESVVGVQQELSTVGAAVVSVVLRSDLSATELAEARAEVERRLTDPGSKVVYNFRSGPGMSLLIASDADLQTLADNPAVERFSVSPPVVPQLNDTRAIVGADAAYDSGYTGTGRTIAVFDTGVDSTHPDLSDNVVDEVCFCNNSQTGPCCPNGTLHQFGPGAAADPDPDGHGTHVAGIVTSAGSIAPRGVAPGTNFVAGRVEGGSFDDIVYALEWLSFEHPEVDAVNLSVGTRSTYGDNCDLGNPDAYVTNLANAIHNLRDMGILTVIASGNAQLGPLGSKSGMSVPACISGVISVGATDKNDVPALFGNQSQGMKLYAPGAGFMPSDQPQVSCPDGDEFCILSTGLGGTTNRMEGTSMAAPHVTAAVALIKQASPDLTADEVEACLLEGPLITDPHPAAGGLTKPRLDIPAAIEACGGDVCIQQTYEAENMTHSVGAAAPPYGWNLHSNGYISTNHVFEGGPTQVRVRALGQSAGGQAPRMLLRVGGTLIGTKSVSATTYTDYTFAFNANPGSQELRIEFDNDFYQAGNPPQDRNLWLDFVNIDCLDELPPTPCADLCANPTPLSWTGSSYQSGNLGTGAICREVQQPLTGGNCGNFAAGRQLRVNGTAMTCNNANWTSVPAPRNGGYCIQAPAGNWAWAYNTLW
jgi:subtilisin family serine protease